MVKILDQLKKIIGVDLKEFLKDIHIEIKIFDFSRKIENKYEVKGNKLIINPEWITPDQTKQIKKEIIDVEIDADRSFLQTSTTEKIKDIKENLPSKKDSELLTFYKDKLPTDYFDALETAMVIRNMSKSGRDITELKRDVMRKYPDFGKNLCNLTSEGYFHNHFKELYEGMSKEEDFKIKDYTRKVERIVKSLPYTVFVNQYETKETYLHQIDYKMDRLKKYGTAKLLIHGLGKENVKKTEEILDEYEELPEVFIEIEKKSTYITATLIF